MDPSIGLLPKKMYAKYYRRQKHLPPNSLRLRTPPPDTSLIGPTAYFGTGKRKGRGKRTRAKRSSVPSSFISQNGIIGDFMSLKPFSQKSSLFQRLRGN